MTKSPSLYIGIMSGTSLDAIDTALVDFSNDTITLIETSEFAFPEDLREETRQLNSPCDNELHRSQVLDKQLAKLFATAANDLLVKTSYSIEDICAIGSHGQTLRHAPPSATEPHGFSLQVGDPNILAELTGITVVADFRGRDIAAGGQGAPLVPAFHKAAFFSTENNRAIINIGGMANISILNKNGHVSGYDTGPGNVLLDHWTKKHQNQKFDRDGNWARTGKVNADLLDTMLTEAFFQLAPPKSTGRELFDKHWLEQWAIKDLASEDVQATLLELTAKTIADAIPEDTDECFICGGGAHNIYLLERLQALSKKPISTTSALGIAPEWIEATAFAWLAKQTMNKIPGNSPATTGAKGERILGAIYSA